MQRKINGLLVLFSLIGGAVGFAIGEYVLHSLMGDMPTIFIVGIYMGILALSIGLFCLIAEMISPRLSGSSWRQQYTGLSWKLLVPATLVLLLVLGTALEFVYELNMGGVKQVKDIVLVIDNSGSMTRTDPDNGRYEAAKSLINNMDQDNQVAIVTFSNKAELVQPFTPTNSDEAKKELSAKIDGLTPTDGGTNIAAALTETMNHIREKRDPKRGTMVILLSDGVSNSKVDAILAEYIDEKIPVNTIGLSLVDASGEGMLQSIASRTGGQYYDVTDADNLSLVFQQIYDNMDDRTLLTERIGSSSDSAYYMVLRILSFVIIGAAIGIALGVVFDNRHLARSFAIGGAAAGLLAGMLLEFGLTGWSLPDGIIRLLADLLLAGVMTMFTLVVPVKESGGSLYRQQRQAGSARAARGIADQPKDRSSRGF